MVCKFLVRCLYKLTPKIFLGKNLLETLKKARVLALLNREVQTKVLRVDMFS